MSSNGSGSGEEAWLKVVEAASICTLPMVLKAAIELKVMDILMAAQQQHAGVTTRSGEEDAQHDAHYLSAVQIAAHFEEHSLKCTNPLPEAAASLDRLLRLLASHGFLASSLHNSNNSSTRAYALNPLSRLLVLPPPTKGQGSLAPFTLLNTHPVFNQTLYNLSDAVLHGGVPFIQAHGMPVFSYIQLHPSFAHTFNLSMSAHTNLLIQALLHKYKGFESIHSLVDVGGGVGACLAMIISNYPHIKGINFDLPHVIEHAPEHPGVLHMGGDMFKSIPNTDVIFMKSILHNWSDDDCIKILKNCYKALHTNGKVIGVDSILPLPVECDMDTHTRYQMDICMFCFNTGSKERTKAELESISKAAGFSTLEVICNVYGFSIYEIYK